MPVSSPNTPDDKKPTNGDVGPHAASGPGAQAPGASGAGSGPNSHGSAHGPASGPGGLVPPWQRGPNGTAAGQAPTGPNGSPQHGDGSNGTAHQPGPPPRGIVSATAAASMAGQQAPITKLDDPRGDSASSNFRGESSGPRGSTATATEETEKFVESPTRHIERDELPGEKLPNLDAIHHVNSPSGTSSTQQTSTRSAPTSIGGRPLRAAVQIRRIDPWATFKIAAVLSVAGFLIWMISVAVLYLILDGMGVWDQVNSSFGTLVTADGSSSEGDIIGAGSVFGWAVLLGAINAILLTALATIGAYIYNLCADMIGGAEVTLADLD
ncbi:hypothetical protein GTV32_15880 [Gordonia sp. SID5947]|uniref:DUF3566 domain-containing protein n=1 Tax=Gordonia sp. SID5947 TaxID=2690315 RepID=UPI00136BC57F|nr:DUF3566 domain-containing protein [Gordonia sp. SID5947]MYR07694.1 hypothetical protein [Gordonia sp. SID5947]